LRGVIVAFVALLHVRRHSRRAIRVGVDRCLRGSDAHRHDDVLVVVAAGMVTSALELASPKASATLSLPVFCSTSSR
jgi:hypothetical protein